jgi:putative heme-binding domain-containing protein
MLNCYSNRDLRGSRSVWPRAAWIGSLAILALAPLAGMSAERLPLTTSHVTGTPEPPPPYSTPRVFPKLQFHNPLEMVVAPGSDRWFVVEQHGKIFSFPDRQDCNHADLLLDIPAQIGTLPADGAVGDTYGLAFHPRFTENRYCYVCYVVNEKQGGKSLLNGSRVSRFRVSNSDPPRCDPASEQILITWPGGGHNGGSLKFGPDGYLYISTGDAADPTPPDPRNTGQDISDLLSSILRIDVDHPSGDLPYSIPADNPFVKTPGARGEVWAYGLRNPWRMSFDRRTGDLWVGDVGWELWEMIDRIKKGGNYGWSIMEGPQTVHPDGKPGPTPLIPPNFYFPHTEAASIIGGYVYRGRRLKELYGEYICGDWVTRRVWAIRFDEDKPVAHRELVNAGPRIVAFGESHAGEIYILDYDLGTIHELQPNQEGRANTAFPTTIAATGLLASVKDHQVAAGVVPFAIVAPQWADYASAERFLALPGLSTVEFLRQPVEVPGSMFKQQFVFPKDAVLMKTFSLEMERGNPASRQRLETQLLHFDGRDWHGYSYRWNAEQTDATLVEPAGADRTLSVRDPRFPGGIRTQTWHYPGRQECLLCHNPWAEYRLAFTLPQLAVKDQIARWKQLALVKGPIHRAEESLDRDGRPIVPMTAPDDPSADLDRRARSYLQVNCAHCHQFGAGGTASVEFRLEYSMAETKAVGARPTQGAFGLRDAKIVSAGDPYASVLYYRTVKTGRGRMPHIGSQLVDEKGTSLLHDWILHLDPHGPSVLPDEARAVERLKAIQEAPAAERSALVHGELSTTRDALLLWHAMQVVPLSPNVRDQIAAQGYSQSEPQIRDLFESFVPYGNRIQRLGGTIDRDRLLAAAGDIERGHALFLDGHTLACNSCHRIGDRGPQVAPELTHIGKKYTRGQLLDKLVDPSKSVDPKFAVYLLQTTDGRSHLGLLVSQTDREVVLRDVKDELIRFRAAEVESLTKQSRSLMPDQLLRDLTLQQAVDLLAFLESLK